MVTKPACSGYSRYHDIWPPKRRFAAKSRVAVNIKRVGAMGSVTAGEALQWRLAGSA